MVDVAQACGSVLGRQGNRFAARRTFVRLGLDRISSPAQRGRGTARSAVEGRSLPHSVAMIDTSVRGRFAPAPPHALTSIVALAAMVRLCDQPH